MSVNASAKQARRRQTGRGLEARMGWRQGWYGGRDGMELGRGWRHGVEEGMEESKAGRRVSD